MLTVGKAVCLVDVETNSAVESFKLSNEPFFIEKVRDIVGLNLNPPEHALVFCVDEKCQVQALERT